MSKTKPMTTTLGGLVQLSKELGAKPDKGKLKMGKVSYSSAISSLVYVMVSTRSDIAHIVGVMSKFMSNPERNIDKP